MPRTAFHRLILLAPTVLAKDYPDLLFQILLYQPSFLDEFIHYHTIRTGALDAYLVIAIFRKQFGKWFIVVLTLLLIERSWSSMGADYEEYFNSIERKFLRGYPDACGGIALLETYMNHDSTLMTHNRADLRQLAYASIGIPNSHIINCPETRTTPQSLRSIWMASSKAVTHIVLIVMILFCYDVPREALITSYNLSHTASTLYHDFYHQIRDLCSYRNKIYAKYRNARAEEVARDDICFFCRESMNLVLPAINDRDLSFKTSFRTNDVSRNRFPKRLPCGHMLHFRCLCLYLLRFPRCGSCQAPLPGHLDTRKRLFIVNWFEWVEFFQDYMYHISEFARI